MEEAAWRSDQCVELAIRQSRLWPLAGFVLGPTEFNRVQIFGHACKKSTGCLLLVVMFCLDYLFQII